MFFAICLTISSSLFYYRGVRGDSICRDLRRIPERGGRAHGQDIGGGGRRERPGGADIAFAGQRI